MKGWPGKMNCLVLLLQMIFRQWFDISCCLGRSATPKTSHRQWETGGPYLPWFEFLPGNYLRCLNLPLHTVLFHTSHILTVGWENCGNAGSMSQLQWEKLCPPEMVTAGSLRAMVGGKSLNRNKPVTILSHHQASTKTTPKEARQPRTKTKITNDRSL